MPISTDSSAGAQEAARLTRRELEVLQVLGSGISSKEAARELFLSKRTIDYHLGHIYRKLNVGNRIQALHHISRGGLLETSDDPAL